MILRRFTSVVFVAASVCVWANVPSTAQQPRLSEITVAHNTAAGRPVNPASVLTPDAGEIFVWARLEGAVPGTVIRSEWFYLGGASPRGMGSADTTVAPGASSVSFSYALAEGRRWPEGAYRVELSAGGRVLGEARFTIAADAGRVPEPTAPRAAHYTHPRAGYSFAPPSGWALEETGPGDLVRLRAGSGAGLIEISTGLDGVRLDPVSYAAGWESASVGPARRLTAKRRGRISTAAGEKSYEAVYEGAGVLCKFVFVGSPDRMFVVSGCFGTDEFTIGEGIVDRLLQSLTLTPPWQRRRRAPSM